MVIAGGTWASPGYDVEVFDPASNGVLYLALPSGGRGGLTGATSPNGSMAIFGGGYASDQTTYYRYLDIYNSATNTLAVAGPLLNQAARQLCGGIGGQLDDLCRRLQR